MIKTDDKERCCGCGTCGLVCPRRCISFEADEIGAEYPVISSEVCISCGRCEQVCPIQRRFENGSRGKAAYAAYSLDTGVRFRGASGGMFETFAGWIIRQGGSVFASKFDGDLKLRCVEANTLSEVRSLTKSKYLQSDCVPMFPLMKQRVSEGKKILFCAAPCQVKALKNYLGGSADNGNVFLIDFVCHGVPSQRIFDKFRAYSEKKRGIKITGFQFRTKIPGGATPHYYTMRYEKNGVEKRKTALYLTDPFYLAFQKYLILRDSCYHCPYGSGHHEGDITVGDFHNIDKYISGINRFDGVSTVIVNTERGKTLWDYVSAGLAFHELDLNALYAGGEIYSGGTAEPARRKEFMEDIRTADFTFVADKWFDSRKEWKKAVYYALPAFVRKLLKKAAGL